MHIIAMGKLPEERTYILTCGYCHTEFQFEKHEAVYRSDQRDGDFLEIDCPLCKRKCFIDVRQTAQSKGW